jgi:hypothetical protein
VALEGAAGLDAGGFGADRGDPRPHGRSHELRAIVGPDVPRHAAQDEQVREQIDDVDRIQPALHPDGQTFSSELVDDVEHAIFSSIARAILDEVVGPDMIRALRPQPDARAVIEPESAFPGLLVRDLQPLPPPDPFHSLTVDLPACMPQQRRDPAVAVAAISGGQRDDIGGEPRLVVGRLWRLALRGAVLAENPASPSLGHTERGNHMLHASAPAGGA